MTILMTPPEPPAPPSRTRQSSSHAPRRTRAPRVGARTDDTDDTDDTDAPALGSRARGIELELQLEELRRTQAALEAARDRYLDLYEFAPVGYLTLDDNGLIIESNQTGAALLGAPRSSLLDSLFAAHVAPVARDAWQRHLLRLTQQRGVERIELTLVQANGQTFYAQLDCLRVSSPGAPPRTRLTLIDVTARRRREDELRVAAMAFHSSDGIMITSPSGIIERVNEAFVQITGYSSEEAVGQRASLLRSERHDAAFHAEIWGALRRYGAWRGEIWNRRKCGEVYPQSLVITAVPDDRGRLLHYVATMRDISARKAHEAAIEQLAFHDALTGLPNRRLMRDRLFHALAASARTGHSGALIFIDLDQFKAVNDGHGHAAGDLLLQQVAHRLSGCVREGDTVARAGGDEFVVVLAAELSEQTETAIEQAATVAAKILGALERPYELNGDTYAGSASLGLTVFNGHDCTLDELIQRADKAMYRAKAAGRNTIRVFDGPAQRHLPSPPASEPELLHALTHGELVLRYRPVVDAGTRLLGGQTQALWRDAGRGLTPPEVLAAATDDQALVQMIGWRALDAVCARLTAWAAEPDLAALTLTLSIDAAQWHAPDFAERVIAALGRSGAPAARLRLELAASVVHARAADCAARMAPLHARGVGFALGGFGSRHALIGDLERLPLSQLKFSASFAREACAAPQMASIARAVADLGQRAGWLIVGDGIESVAQRDSLADLGCRAFQGPLFGPPRSARSLREMLHATEQVPRTTDGGINAP